MIGNIFKRLEIGERQYSAHSLGRSLKVVNWAWMVTLQAFNHSRGVGSRLFTGTQNGPLNYSGLFMFIFATCMVSGRLSWNRSRDAFYCNQQDKPEYWFDRYNLMFPPSYLHNRLSAHYIEISHIYCVEMLRKYQVARKEILDARDQCSDQEKRTRYVLNPNYIYEPLGPDSPQIARAKADGVF